MKRTPSVTARVTIAATAAVALVLVTGGVLTVTTFARHERSSLDRQLQRRAQGPIVRAVRPEGPLPPPGAPPPLSAESGSFARVLEGDRVVVAVGDVPGGGFPVPESPGLATIEAAGSSWRTLTVERSVDPARRVQLAANLDPQEERISELRTRVIVISSLGIVLAAVLARLFSVVALQPLSGLRRAAAGVTTTRDLSRRIPEHQTPEEVAELARSVNAMLARLETSASETEKALEATRRFAADVGHELRTPLTSIRANLDALRRNPSMQDAQRQAILEEVAAEQSELVALLDALQALARGDAGAALSRETLDFAEVVDAAVAAARRRHQQVSITLEVPEGRHPVHGWPDGLRLLVDNLVENAARHGGSKVRVGLESDSDAVVLSIDDDGPGVPAAERERVFERFVRGADTPTPGYGLGLALVAQQVALHQGSVEVGDSDLGGARFSVRLPRSGQ